MYSYINVDHLYSILNLLGDEFFIVNNAVLFDVFVIQYIKTLITIMRVHEKIMQLILIILQTK